MIFKKNVIPLNHKMFALILYNLKKVKLCCFLQNHPYTSASVTLISTNFKYGRPVCCVYTHFYSVHLAGGMGWSVYLPTVYGCLYTLYQYW